MRTVSNGNHRQWSRTCAFLLILVLIGLFPSHPHALSQPYLVQNINPQLTSSSHFPVGKALTEMNGVFYFTGSDPAHGSELWKTDGTIAGTVLVRDINPGGTNASPANLTVMNGSLYFSADDGENGIFLWKSDGTENGTAVFKNISPKNLIAVNGFLYIFTTNSQLWISDGTPTGTTQIKTFTSNVYSNMTAVGSLLFFSHSDTSSGTELWVSDGTTGGTKLVKDIYPGTSGSTPSNLTSFNGKLFFSANNGSTVNGVELWSSDGTEAGTGLVKDINPGVSNSSPANLTVFNGKLFFSATNGSTANGIELWSSDGSAVGTTMHIDINPGVASSSPASFRVVNGHLLFSATNGAAVNGVELWKVDGTTGISSIVKDINPNSASSSPLNLTRLNNLLIFSATNATQGNELWVSDGTATGTTLLKDIYPGSTGSNPLSFTVINTTVYFQATEPSVGSQYWKTDGSPAGTLRMDSSANIQAGSSINNVVTIGSTIYFTADAGWNTRHLYKSDGSGAGTFSLMQFPSSYPFWLTNVGSTLFFVANDGIYGEQLWKSDGSSPGTLMIKDFYPPWNSTSPLSLIGSGGSLYFVATDPIMNVPALWRTDGTQDGTQNVYTFWGSFPQINSLTDVNGILYFVFQTTDTFTSTISNQLWKSNGTSIGTGPVMDFGTNAPGNLVAASGKLFFIFDDGITGLELWKSDGTAAGTALIKDIYPGTSWSSPSSLTAFNGTLYFVADDGVNGSELWKSDGTEAGTTLVKDIKVTPGAGSSIFGLTVHNGFLYFAADDGVHGRELWKSDGTGIGTVQVKDIRSGVLGSSATALASSSAGLFFSANDGVNGEELWISDGSESGTKLVYDLYPGSGGSNPDNLKAANTLLFFSAYTEEYGRELWALSISADPLLVTPDPVAFGDVSVVSPVTQYVTIQNTGETPLPITSISISGPNQSDNAMFTVAPQSCTSLAPTIPAGGNCTVKVTFIPASSGSRSSNLVVVPGQPAQPHTIQLSGTGVVPTVQLTVVKAGNGSGMISLSPSGQIFMPEIPPDINTTIYEYPYGTEVTLTATTDPGSQVTWDGCTPISATQCRLTVSGFDTVTATFSLAASITFNTMPDGLAYSVDGVTYTTAQSFTWLVGSQHMIAASSPQLVDTDHSYVFDTWTASGLPTLNTMITVGSGSYGSYTATFHNEFEPSISGFPRSAVTVGVDYRFKPTAVNALTFSIGNKPSWAAFDTTTGILSGTPGPEHAGVYSNITISAVHGTLSSTLFPFSITVTPQVRGALLTPRYHHSAIPLPNGMVLIAGGTDGEFPASAEIYDPTTGFFRPTGSMNHARWAHTATLLPNGRVLFVGGTDANGLVSSAELYDPTTGLFTVTGAPQSGHGLHTATLLQNGKVLIAGGNNTNGRLGISEIYDPATGTFTLTGSMMTPSALHTATLLPDGSVVIIGGSATGSSVTARAERYNPGTGQYEALQSMAVPRSYHTATLLRNGNILVAGGYEDTTTKASAEIYDPAQNIWSPTGSMTVARSEASATLLPNGTVLVIGGPASNVLPTNDIYDPATGLFAPAGATTARRAHSATMLSTGSVLVTGGSEPSYQAYGGSELIDPPMGTFEARGTMASQRSDHTSTMLATGQTLIAGGRNSITAGIDGSELYNPESSTFSATGSMATGRYLHTATLLATGNVMVTGGSNGSDSALSSSEQYNPVSGLYEATGSLNTARSGHSATLLPSGRVLVAGGRAIDGSYTSSAEVYDSPVGNFGVTGSLDTPRANHTSTLLQNGKVLITGGRNDSSSQLVEAELYDPASSQFASTGSMQSARADHSATLLPNGKVLVVGGDLTAELFDPATEQFSVTGSPNAIHAKHIAILLQSGKVLITGGGSEGNIAELYDPATGLFTVLGTMSVPRSGHAAMQLASGDVLISGGAFSGAYAASAEVYKDGRDFVDSQRPQIGSLTKSGNNLVISGAGLAGSSEGSTGTFRGSPSNNPTVQLRRIDNGQTVNIPTLTGSNWSSTSLILDPAVSGFASVPYLLTVSVSGIPSTSMAVVPDATQIPIRVRTIPEGLGYTVDGTAYTSQQTFTWLSGETHTLETTVLQSGGSADSWYELTGWNNNGDAVHSVITPAASTDYIARFVNRLQPTISGIPPVAAGRGVPFSFAPSAQNAASFSIVNKPAWAQFNAVTGSLSGTPGPVDVGETNGIVITAHNGFLNASLPAFSLTVYGSPTIGGTPPEEVNQGASYSFAPFSSNTIQFSIANKPTWADFDTSTGVLSGIPGAGDVGTTNAITITALNGILSTSLAPFSITVLGKPVISGTPSTSIRENEAYSFTPTATNTVSFSVFNKPAWALFDAGTGTLSGTPGLGDAGLYENIIITAINGTLTTSLPPFTIAVNATISGRAPSTAPVGLAYSFQPVISAVNGSSPVFSVQNKPVWANFDSATGVLYGTPSGVNVGTYSNIVISVQDGALSASLPPFAITVYYLKSYFNPVATSAVDIAVPLSDGKLLATGSFLAVDGSACNFLCRLHTDGSVDTSFTAPLVANPGAVVVQPDNKIFVAGGMGTNRLSRLNSDGSLDPTFVAPDVSGMFSAVALQADGRIVVAGEFTSINGQAYSNIARLNADGTLDSSYNAAADARVYGIGLQSDGKALVWGEFTTLVGQPKNRLGRIKSDGTLDVDFIASVDSSAVVQAVAQQANGQIVVGGTFSTFNGQPRGNIARLNPDGTLDASFSPDFSSPNPVIVMALALQPDGRIMVGGDFASINNDLRYAIARLNPDGSLDFPFNPGTDAQQVRNLTVLSNQKIVVGGSFTRLGGKPVNYLGRLHSDGTLDDQGGGSITVLFSMFPDTGFINYMVDGQTYHNPALFDWEVGSTHTISAATVQAGLPGTQHTFMGWSDDGAATHTITATTSMTSYTGIFDSTYVPPTISGTPSADVDQEAYYEFMPSSTNASSFGIINRPGWATFNTATGKLSGVPTEYDVGTYTGIAIIATSGPYSAQLEPFSIKVHGQPTISGTPASSVNMLENFSFTPTATNAERFSIANKPAWATFSTVTGTLTGTPGLSDDGVASGIIITVHSGGLTASLPPFSITVIGIPTISGVPQSYVDQGSMYSFLPTYTSTSRFEIVQKPSWASFNTATGELRGTPGAGDVGITTGIIITAINGTLRTSLTPFSIEVFGQPTISGTPQANVKAGTFFDFTPTVANASSFTITNQPQWAVFVPQTGRLYGTPSPGDASVSGIVITAHNGGLSASLPPFTITVIPLYPTALAITGGPDTILQGTSANYAATVTWDNATQGVVTPVWSVSPSTYASINEGGVLTVGSPPANQIVTITASFSVDGVSRTTARTVTITVATVLTFDDAKPIDPRYPELLNNYHGYNFMGRSDDNNYWPAEVHCSDTYNEYKSILSASFPGVIFLVSDQMYNKGIISPDCALHIYGDYYSPTHIFDINSDGQFTFNGAYFTALNNDLTLTIKGWKNNNLQYEQAISLTAGNATFYSLNFSDIDRLSFKANRVGACNDPPYCFVSYLVDDLSVYNLNMPTISGIPATLVKQGNIYSFIPTAKSAAGFSISNQPGWATFNTLTGELSGTPGPGDIGTYGNIVISAINGTARASLPPFSITVADSLPISQATFQTVPPGLSYLVDGITYSGTQTFNWEEGSSHMVAVVAASQDAGVGVRDTFTGWSDGQAITHTVIAQPNPATYTASFAREYLLTTDVSPVTGGTVSPAGAAYYPAGAVVSVMATPEYDRVFSSWSGPVANAASATTTVTMNAPVTVTAAMTPKPVYPLSLTLQGGNGADGVVFSSGESCVSDCSVGTVQGNQVNLTAVPDAGRILKGWTGCDSSSGSVCSITSTAPRAVTVVFDSYQTLPVAAGDTVSVSPTAEVAMTFTSTTSPGTVTVQAATMPGEPLPGSFGIAGGSVYEISTTAEHSGPITVCINYNPATIKVSETALKLYHFNVSGGYWEDITTSVNTASKKVCGISNSLSPFAVAQDENSPAPDVRIVSGPSSPNNSTTATFTFNVTSTQIPIYCSLDSAPWGVCKSPLIINGLSAGPHTLQVKADYPLRPPLPPASWSWMVDTTPPTTSIGTTPPNPAFQQSAGFTFTSNEADSSFECKIDSGVYGVCSSPFTLSSLVDGTHTFTVRAKDAAGNYDIAPSSYTWTIDSMPPETAINGFPGSIIRSGSGMFVFHSDKPGATFQCTFDGGPWSSCTSPANFSGMAEGSHTFQVRAISSTNGLIDPTPASFTFAVDSTPPDTMLTSHPPNPSNSGSGSFSFSSSEANSTFECSLDGGQFTYCSSPYNFNGLGVGNHTFAVYASDAVINIDTTPAEYTWNIVAPNSAVTIGGVTTSHDTLSGAFMAIAPGTTASVKAQYMTFVETITLDAVNAAVTLAGGYSSSMSSVTGKTTIQGRLNIKNGRLNVRNVIIKPVN